MNGWRFLPSGSSQASEGSMQLTGIPVQDRHQGKGRRTPTQGRVWLQQGCHWYLCSSRAQACQLGPSIPSFHPNTALPILPPAQPICITPPTFCAPAQVALTPGSLEVLICWTLKDDQLGRSNFAHTWTLVRQGFPHCLTPTELGWGFLMDF